MLDVNVKFINELKEFVRVIATDIQLLNLCRSSEQDFVRNRKLPFDKLVFLITRLCKKTLSIEIENFFSDAGLSQSCSTSAFVQQRKKLKPLFFKYWNKFLCETWYQLNAENVKMWNRYRLVAVDGSNITLINKPNLIKHYGGQRNQTQSFTVAKTFYYYDVLNELILDSTIGSYHYGELSIAYDMVERTQPDMLLIYDRNFGNYKTIALHLWQEQERKFVIRAKEHLSIIKDFIATGKETAMVEWPPTPDAIKGMRKSGYTITVNTRLRVRLVRVDLPTGATEVLITNLWENEGHTNSIFKDLYFSRWGIETNISLQKNIMQLESVSGLSVTAVEQDFYATIFVANLHAVLIKNAQSTVESNGTHRKYPVKINKNKSFGKLKSNLTLLFLHNNAEEILKKLNDQFIKQTVPIRKGRSFERVRKNFNSKSKFKTFSNFKPSF